MDSFLILLVFDANNRLLVRLSPDGFTGPSYFAENGVFAGDPAVDLVEQVLGVPGRAHLLTQANIADQSVDIYCALCSEGVAEAFYMSLDQLDEKIEAGEIRPSPVLIEALKAIEPHLVRIPYLDFSETEYIYRFRNAKERNSGVYVDQQSEALYQSELCRAIKAARRTKEKKSGAPAILDFGAVSYVIPSHFGFCLGVQNAIERAYETVASNPTKRVFMLSELIHNPFVNEDLLARGLRYLQSDKGLSICEDGSLTADRNDPKALWNQLTGEDIVIIPAFGATNEDKVRLLRRGLSIRENDATCMLVEKVWKAARRYAEDGYTVIIHGKSEHEETKATFSNSSSYGPALMIRNMAHAELLTKVIQAEGAEKTRLFEESFKGLYSKGFNPEVDLEKLAVVNQTTLLRNETLSIIEFLRAFMVQRYGEAQVAEHLWSKGKGDTLCYATQVNQDALQKAVEESIDAALVVGGKNSSNTFQLYRVCEQRFGENAHYIQSEANIRSAESIEHYIFPYQLTETPQVSDVVRPFLDSTTSPKRILLTGGASCPDGVIQQVIHKINSFFPEESIRSIESILEAFEAES
ncbi:4-hydroxy-3-methylbut-2-enyl diphosphate reductase (EC [Lentimonas sp. CC19]|nr:4-hydroxy-3-methylbut-2-enyl diphosphate reductase (EC [Lentimonas sp. CC19]CAA6696468.1 4-hydroxy-3-methylbut-2-enyl diphosphate reductase (EC [Lentimonas sp. CC10]CAA7072371.1 4-hydroxy-3-methylbut-2-enyl diphosphate reductase (EC [Lentimonas sp. CC11]